MSEEEEIPFTSVGEEGMLKPNEVVQVAIEDTQILLCNAEFQ